LDVLENAPSPNTTIGLVLLSVFWSKNGWLAQLVHHLLPADFVPALVAAPLGAAKVELQHRLPVVKEVLQLQLEVFQRGGLVGE
jgi:hypothetical protein